MDGFANIPISQLEAGSPLNLEPYRNEYSPFSRVHEVSPAISGDGVLVDTYYGLAYDGWIRRGGAPYGMTAAIPVGPLDSLATGYLRIPFARVPCIAVGDKEGLSRVLDRVQEVYSGLTFLFRGQDREYLLNRSAETHEALYGSQVREPSLLPSAERRGVNIDAVGPAWCGMLSSTLDLWASARKDDAQLQLIHEVGQQYRFHHFALAMAQHYGLPSSGLDVTNSIEVALFFALHRFTRPENEPGWLMCSRLQGDGSVPVLYVFAVEIDPHYIRFERSLLGELPENRPSRQSAFFLQRGWGMARNRAARSLVAALYLDPDGEYGLLPGAEDLFPGPDEDVFGKAFESARLNLSDSLPELTRFVQDFAWVRPYS